MKYIALKREKTHNDKINYATAAVIRSNENS